MIDFRKIYLPIKKEVNYLFFRRIRYKRVVRRHLAQYYTDQAPRATNEKKMIVYTNDGRALRGGLADRLRGMVTMFRYAMEHDCDFRIFFTSPYRLEDYLIPAAYDWTVKNGELSYNAHDSKPVYMDNIGTQDEREFAFQRKVTEDFLNGDYKQYHVYSTFYYEESHFHECFQRLFRPSEALDRELTIHGDILGDSYISVSTRFLELLGDFTEPDRMATLDEEGKKRLMDACVGVIERLHEKHPESKIFVTSDSLTFLRYCSIEHPYVYIIDGEIVHSDMKVEKNDTMPYMKTFVDFMLISRAKKAYQIVVPPMYAGNFSMRAAEAGGVEFERVHSA